MADAVRRQVLVQLLLPRYDAAGVPWPATAFEAVRAELTARFGGVTAYLRAPASGAWEDDAGVVRRDEVFLLEVLAPTLERAWWQRYARSLEARFAQQEVVVRAMAVERL